MFRLQIFRKKIFESEIIFRIRSSLCAVPAVQQAYSDIARLRTLRAVLMTSFVYNCAGSILNTRRIFLMIISQIS